MGLTAGTAGVLLRAGAWGVRIRAPRAVSRALSAVLAAVVIPEHELPTLDIVVSDAGQARGSIRGEEVWTMALPKRGWLAPLLGYTVGTATSLLRDVLFVHAAAVAFKEHGYVLVGAPGAGKTSIAAALVRHGASYLSDEVALLDAKSGALRPFALPLAVKPWTTKAIGAFPPTRRVAAEGGVRYLLPTRRAATPVRFDAMILLDPSRRAAGTAAYSRAEMLMMLSQHASSFRYRPRLESAFSGFVQLLRNARCLQVGSAVPSEAAAAIASRDGRSR